MENEEENFEFSLTELGNNIIIEWQTLIRSREEFENQLYDFLVSPLFVDETFWEPVKVTLTASQLGMLNEVYNFHECLICAQEFFWFNELICCKQLMCLECAIKWFNYESVYCPFCKVDIREKLL